MNIACADDTVAQQVQAVLRLYPVSRVREQGPNLNSAMIWVMVDSKLGQDQDGALRRQIAQIHGATIRS